MPLQLPPQIPLYLSDPRPAVSTKMNSLAFSSPVTSKLCEPYSLTLEQRTGYLYARVTADVTTLRSAITYLSEIADRCAHSDCKRVLIERDVPAVPSTTDMFYIGQEFARMMRGVQIAVLNPYVSNDDALNFGIIVGTNRGVLCEMHRTFDSAARWLLGSQSK